jgi:NAD-dependent dihydropyrimidine dehydrogenase PreA subunit
MYVDENLCAGCGLCVDACDQHAISIQRYLAVIDPAACTNCARCALVCITGALGTTEIVPKDGPPFALGRPQETLPLRPGAPLTSFRMTSLAPVERSLPAKPSEQARSSSVVRPSLETVERLVSGVLGLLNFVLDAKAGRASIGKGRSALAQMGNGQRQFLGKSGGVGRGVGRGAGRRGSRHSKRCRNGL